MSITMEDPIGSYWAVKSHKDKTEEIIRLAGRVKVLESALGLYAKVRDSYGNYSAKRALAAKEPK